MWPLVSSARKSSPSPTPVLTSIVCKNRSSAGAHEVWQGRELRSVEARCPASARLRRRSDCLQLSVQPTAFCIVAMRNLPVSTSEGGEVWEWRVTDVHDNGKTRNSSVSSLCVDRLCRNPGCCGTVEITSPVSACRGRVGTVTR